MTIDLKWLAYGFLFGLGFFIATYAPSEGGVALLVAVGLNIGL